MPAHMTRYDTSAASSSPLVPAPSNAPPLNSACMRNNRDGDEPRAAVAATFMVTSTSPPADTVTRNATQNAARLVVAASTTETCPHGERRREHRPRTVSFRDHAARAVRHCAAEHRGGKQEAELCIGEVQEALHVERDDRPGSPEEPERDERRPQRSHTALWLLVSSRGST